MKNAPRKPARQPRTEVERQESEDTGRQGQPVTPPATAEDEIDEAGRESFPASDPPFWTAGVVSG